MGSMFSKSPSKEKVLEEKLRDEFYDIFSNLHQDCEVSALACYYSAGRHETFARVTEITSSAFGVLSAGGFGVMHFYKGGLSLKGKGILGGASSILAACFGLSTLFGGIKNSTRSPGILSKTYNESASEWDEISKLLDVYKRVKVRDPYVNLSELEMMCREIIRRRKEVGLKTRVEDWAYRKALKDFGLFPVETKFELTGAVERDEKREQESNVAEEKTSEE